MTERKHANKIPREDRKFAETLIGIRGHKQAAP